MKYIIVGLNCILFMCCSSSNRKYIGRVDTDTDNKIYFRIYQDIEFMDNVTALLYEIRDSNDSLLHRPTFLYGTEDFDINDTKSFSAGIVDSIIYLTWGDANLVYVLFDLKTLETRDCNSNSSKSTNLEARICVHWSDVKFKWNTP